MKLTLAITALAIIAFCAANLSPSQEDIDKCALEHSEEWCMLKLYE